MRLRGAILQTVVNVVEHRMHVEEAIEAPRVHVEEPHVHCEGGADPAEVDAYLAHTGLDNQGIRATTFFIA